MTFSQVPIPTDNVGLQAIARPRPWDIVADIEVYRVHWTHQFDFRLHDVCDDVVRVQVQPVDAGHHPAELASAVSAAASADRWR